MHATLEQMTVWGLISDASLLVKGVMAILLLASLFSWYLIVQRGALLARVERQAKAFQARFRGTADLNLLQRKHGPKAEMNVVPYIDVMLVLLVIFMVTAPMLTQGVKIELPKVASEALPRDSQQRILTLSVQADGGYYWNLGTELDTKNRTDSAVALEEMTAKVGALIAERGDTQVYIRADQDAGYGKVVAAMAALQQGGVANLGLITEAPQ